MIGLALNWLRCPDGVEVVDLPHTAAVQRFIGTMEEAERVAAGVKTRRGYRYKTDARVADNHRLVDLKDPLVLKFMHARDTDSMLRFLSTYGLTVDWADAPVPLELVEDERIGFSAALNTIRHGPPAAATRQINEAFARYVEGGVSDYGLAPIFEYTGPESPPRLTLLSFSLRAYMAMELAFIASRGASVSTCERCNKRFITGPTTGRRSDAKYCADRCRVGASRARKTA